MVGSLPLHLVGDLAQALSLGVLYEEGLPVLVVSARGGVSQQEILSFWKGGGATAALWIGPGVGETALVLLLRWVVETVRQRLALPGEKSVP